ncbi:glutathione synthase [Pelagophyceae sp. CCMP2097]|nr:glutathione synthase [Pelagophyceae sp. CCMP2097]|mmetsp:Transcript_19153/g.64691  ORF Transcript_19153/g.64691 Transcript_19153/m.64691 type:complete len:509 (-) Transcript_19153:159-1685(-)
MLLVLFVLRQASSLVRGRGAAAPARQMSALFATAEEREKLLPDAVAWCVGHGALYALKSTEDEKLGKSAFEHAPFALAPFCWPRASYEHVVALQPLFNVLVDRVARDGPWLRATLAEAAAGDAFTARLLRVHADCSGDQQVACGLLRSDYMLDVGGGAPRALQVELNTVAASFGCLSTTIAALHRFLEERLGGDAKDLPLNGAAAGLANGLAVAHVEYARQRGAAPGAARLVMVVQPGERNQLDQRKLEYELWENHAISIERLTLAQLAARAAVDAGGALVVTHPSDGTSFEVSVAYFRAGYAPDDYPSELEWAAREVIEQSNAIKCPTAAYQLAGTKKVQQALAAPGVLERFLPDGDDAARLRTCFAGLYDLDVAAGTAADAAVAAALAEPQRFVLKPQREGGGNNFYGEDLARELRAMAPQQRAAFILMDRIVPPAADATLVRDGMAIVGACVAELGIYGTLVTDGRRTLLNETCGHLLRQKLLGVDEGGVAAGFAVLSSPRLVDA